jgi:hypothetical protein
MKQRISDYLEAEVEIAFEVTSYHPYRPAPHIEDHDHPLFGDTGDSEECEFELYYVEHVTTFKDGKREPSIVFTPVKNDKLYDALADEICEWCRENLIPDDEDPDAYDRYRDEADERLEREREREASYQEEDAREAEIERRMREEVF